MNPINLAVQQIKAALGYDVRYGAAGWQMKVGPQWITANAQASQTFDAILAQITASVVAGQLQNQAQGGGSGGGSGGGGRGGVRSRIRLSRHPGVSFGIPGVRLRLGARPGLILSPGSEEGPIGTAAVYGATIIGLVGSITAALATASRHAMQYSREVLTLSQQSGMGLRASQTAINTAGGFGIGAGEISSQNILFQRARAGIYGGSGTGDEADIRAFRQMYRRYASQGPLGLLSAQRIAESTGKTPYINAASMPQGMFEAQMRRTSQLGQAFGLSPHQLEQAGYATKNFFDTIGQAFSLFWTKIGGAVTEKLQPIFDRGLDWLAAHSGVAGAAIEKGVGIAFDRLIRFGFFLKEDLPRWAVSASLGVLIFIKTLRDAAVNQWNDTANSTIGRALGMNPITTSDMRNGMGMGGATGAGIGAAFGGGLDSGMGARAGRGVGDAFGPGGSPGAGRPRTKENAAFWAPAWLVALLAQGNVSAAGVGAALGAGTVGAGLGLGVAGYELLRKSGVLGEGQLSTAQILQYGLYKATGVNTMGGGAPGSAGDIIKHVTDSVIGGVGGAASSVGNGLTGGGDVGGGGDVLDSLIDRLMKYQASMGPPLTEKERERQIQLLERIASASEKTASQAPMTPEEWASALRSRGRYEAQDRLRASYNVG